MEFDFETALFIEDTRQDCGEVRWQAPGLLDGRLHMLVFAETATGIRVISFRKANKREVKRYEQATRP
ncbi:BrnT family toxin [Rhodanobacter sp. Si-c]|uniref:BrnT family toxin n=1 Tax=Rhodanobacter lycopersici TaxID=3162487 RepID=A0ABV3QAJ7_9GAMM